MKIELSDRERNIIFASVFEKRDSLRQEKIKSWNKDMETILKKMDTST